MFDSIKLGSFIQQSRKIAKMSQETLANRVGVSRQTIMRIENGKIDSIAFKTVLDVLNEVGWDIDLNHGVFVPQKQLSVDEIKAELNRKYQSPDWTNQS